MTKPKKSIPKSASLDPLLVLEAKLTSKMTDIREDVCQLYKDTDELGADFGQHHREIGELQEALNCLPSVLIKNNQEIMNHINRHEGILMKMNGVKDFSDKPEPEVTERVDGDIIEWAIAYIQDGLDVLKKQFEREGE